MSQHFGLVSYQQHKDLAFALPCVARSVFVTAQGEAGEQV